MVVCRYINGMKVATGEVLSKKVHQFYVVWERLKSLASIVWETGGMFYDCVDPIQPYQEVGMLAKEAVILCRGGVAR